MTPNEILALTARGIAARVQSGALSIRQVTEASLRRISETDGPVQAWHHLDGEAALRRADVMDRKGIKGPLAGVPVGVKDVIETFDMPTGYGTPVYEGFQPAADAACVSRSRAAGAMILGKTVSTELAMASPNKTRNPHNPAHTPGGSSSGSCAAVAAGHVPLAYGTQTSGSVIRPSSFCGVTAFKPSHGLINTVGMKVLCHSLDTLGIISRNVGDAAFCASVLSGCEGLADLTPPSRPRLAVLTGTRLERADPAALEAVERLAARAEACGAEVTHLDPPAWFDGIFDLHSAVMGHEVTHSLSHEINAHWQDLSPVTRAMLENEGKITPADYHAALQQLPGIRHLMNALLSRFDAVLTLAAPGEAPEGMPTGDPIFNRLWSVLQVPLFNLPGARGPKGLPIGVQLVGAFGADLRLAAAAAFLETAQSGAKA